MLYAVGKPVYHKFSEEQYGAWLRDPSPRNDLVGERYWCTKENDTVHLYEYANKVAYRNNANTKTYRLERPFRVSVMAVNQFFRDILHHLAKVEGKKMSSDAQFLNWKFFLFKNNFLNFSLDWTLINFHSNRTKLFLRLCQKNCKLDNCRSIWCS